MMTVGFYFQLALRILLVCGTVCGTAFAGPRDYPAKPVRIKVAFPAGGPADGSLRDALPTLQRAHGQPFVVENVAGAGGSIGAMAVLRAATDGYTLLCTTASDLILAPLSITTAKYKPEGFRPIGLLTYSDFVLISSPSLPFNTLDQLIEHAKTSGRQSLSIAHWGHGSTPHIVAADFQMRTGLRLLEIPYKGAASIIPDIGGGQVDLTFFPLGGPLVGLIKGGKVKPIAITADRRSPALPDVPTVNESRLLRDFRYGLWSALFAPPGTPDSVIIGLNRSLNDYRVSAEGIARADAIGARLLAPMDAAQTAAFYQAEHDRLLRVAKAINLIPQ